MNVQEALVESQDIAHEMLVEQFDTQRGIPMRAPSHTDLWVGDRWPEAYLAADEPELAQQAMGAIARSLPEDSTFPHLMQGSHKRAGIETRLIDRTVYRIQGNGARHLPKPNREWVTRSVAPATQGLSALALRRAGYAVPLSAPTLVDAALALYARRGTDSGLLALRKADELTRSTAEYQQQLKQEGSVVDPAINALMVNNNAAIREYALSSGWAEDVLYDPSFKRLGELTAQTEQSLASLLHDHRSAPQPEEVLATARLTKYAHNLSERDLAVFFTAPSADDDHPERRHVTMAETIEVARLTPWSEESQKYLQRILPVIAEAGASAMTRFEGNQPGKNAITNKYNRKHLWLLTAAEIVQINVNDLQ